MEISGRDPRNARVAVRLIVGLGVSIHLFLSEHQHDIANQEAHEQQEENDQRNNHHEGDGQ